jgi:hypothetical protein
VCHAKTTADLIGCDGARRKSGATLNGDTAVVQAQLTYIRAPTLLGKMPRPLGRPTASARDIARPRLQSTIASDGGR